MPALELPGILGLRRLTGLLLCAIGPACATTSNSTEVSVLRGQVKAMQQTHLEDQKKIEALQAEVEVLSAETRASQSASDLPSDLRVVHLTQPGKGHPPPLATAVPIHEPTSAEMALISAARASEPIELDSSHMGSTTGAPSASSPEEADALFTSAFEKLKTGELVRSANEFHEFARRYPHHPAADNALLDEGIAFYGLRQYADALSAFRTLIKRYPAGDAVPEALYREAECAERLGHRDQARSLLSQLRDSYPQSAEAERAGRRLEELAANEGEGR
jgi:tol-pal system protein YbgF